MPALREKNRPYVAAILFVTLFILSSATGALGQERKFSVSFDPPSERPATGLTNIFVRVTDPTVVRLSLFCTNPQQLTSHAVGSSMLVHSTVDVPPGQASAMVVVALRADGSVAEQRMISIGEQNAGGTAYVPAGQTQPPAHGTNVPVSSPVATAPAANFIPAAGPVPTPTPAAAPKAIAIEHKVAGSAKGTASDSRQVIEIKPDFQVDKEKRNFLIVEISNAGRVSRRYPIEIKEDDIDSTTKKIKPKTVAVDLVAGVNNIRVLHAHSKNATAAVNNIMSDEFTIDCFEPCGNLGRNINTRAILGFEQTGASSATGKVAPFANFFISAPIGTSSSALKQPKWSFWTDFRLSSTAAQRFIDVSKITTAFSSTASGFSTNEVVQSFRVNMGIERRIAGGDTLIPFFKPGKSSISAIAGVGISAPLSYQKEVAAEIFRIPLNDNNEPTLEFQKFYEDLRNGMSDKVLLPELDPDMRNIAFMQPERVRFYKRAFVGGRLKVDFWEDHFRQMDLSPAIFDLTFGIDESVRSGYKPSVVSFEGFVPFPIGDKNFIYLYGGGTVALTREGNANIAPIYMQRGAIDDLESNSTIVIPGVPNPFTRSSRDGYFFGIGIDFLKLFGSASSGTAQ